MCWCSKNPKVAVYIRVISISIKREAVKSINLKVKIFLFHDCLLIRQGPKKKQKKNNRKKTNTQKNQKQKSPQN